MQRGSTRVICILQTQQLSTIHSFLVERVQTTLINQQDPTGINIPICINIPMLDHRGSVSGVLHQPLPLRCSFHKVEGFTPTTAVQGGSLVQTCQSISCGNATCSQYLSICGYESKLCMERSALFRTYGTKGFRNWSCSGPLELWWNISCT